MGVANNRAAHIVQKTACSSTRRRCSHRWSLHKKRGKPYWYEKWKGPELVLFGHTQSPMPRVQTHGAMKVSIGLDTGCVHHGRGRDGCLTAWLPESLARTDGGRPFDAPDDRFWHVPAKRRYYYPSHDRG